ncbi:MAG: hypothetical protein ACK4N5_05215 [Myxococcales bacterium]
MSLFVPTPHRLKELANARFSDLVLNEIARSRERVAELERTYPSASRRELAQRLIDKKKSLAGTSGAVSGLFGLVSVPLDLTFVTYLQISLLVDLAVLFRVNLKSARARDELLDLLGYANGVGPLVRAGPRVLGRITQAMLARGGLPGVGRAVPVVAAPLTAWLNNRSLSRVGAEGLRHYAQEEKRRQRESA